MEYTNIKTFDQLCLYGSLFVSDRVKKFPGWKDLKDGKKALCEMVEEYEWIGKFIFGYNLLGFFTVSSQPGTIYKTEIYSNHYDYMMNAMEESNPQILEGNYELYQRAFVNGWMEKDKAIKFYNLIKQNPNYLISLSCFENEIPKEYEICTLVAKDGIPMFKELEESHELLKKLNLFKLFDKDPQFKKIPHIPATYYGGRKDPEPNAFEKSQKKYLINMDSQYFDPDVIVCVSIMDKRWNNNDEFWTDILNCLYKIR